MFRFPQISRSVARQYSTAQKAIALDAALVKHLKPEVISAINSKTDQLLIKKLNFVGPTVAVRLNTASKIVLQALTQDNCLQILTEELSDPWEYYWLVVNENSNNPDKWLASLEEVKDVPVVAHKCWVEMMKNGVHPRIAHYHTYFYSLSLTGDSHNLHEKIDEFERKNTLFRDKGTEETWNLVLEFYLKKGIYPLAQLAADDVVMAGDAVKPELATRLAELKAKHNEEAAFEYFLGESREEPSFVKEAREIQENMEKRTRDMVEQYYQPALEKLVVKE